jgi:sulfur carrier protein
VTVSVNGAHRELADDATVLAALALLDVPADAQGIAVAVDSEVVPRGEWASRALVPGASVEVLTAMQGG